MAAKGKVTANAAPANVPVASTQARPTSDVTQGPDASQDADRRYVAPARTAGGFAGSAPSPHGVPPQYPAMPQATPDKPLPGSIGATGTSIMAGILIGEDYNPDFGWRRGVEIFDQMRRSNGTVKAIEQLLAMPLRAATWSIKPASDKPDDKKLASFVESALFHEMEFCTPEGVEQHQTWDDILRHACLSMTYGFMPFEMVWREDEHGFTKWAQWLPLLPRTIWRWWVNQQTDLVGVQQRTYINYGWYYRDIPASKLLLFTNEREGNNYEGMSVFRAAYPHWFYLQQYYKIQAVGIERNAVTPPIGYLGPLASGGDRDNLFAVVQNMRVGESMGAVLQNGEKIEYPANHQSQGADVQQAIDHHMQMMAQAAVTSFLTLGASAKGAFNLAESMIGMLMTLLQARAQYICDTINAGPIKQLVRYNFGPQAVYPQLCVGRLTATDITRVANALAALAGYIPPSNEITDYLTKMIGLPEAAHSEVQATNPSGKDGAGAGGGGGEDSDAVKATQRVGQNVVRANFNPALDDAVTEARLLREAIGALTGLDAVEGAQQFFNPNHNPPGPGGGEFASGGAGGAGGSGAESGHGRGGATRTDARASSTSGSGQRARSGRSRGGGGTSSGSGDRASPGEGAMGGGRGRIGARGGARGSRSSQRPEETDEAKAQRELTKASEAHKAAVAAHGKAQEAARQASDAHLVAIREASAHGKTFDAARDDLRNQELAKAATRAPKSYERLEQQRAKTESLRAETERSGKEAYEANVRLGTEALRVGSHNENITAAQLKRAQRNDPEYQAALTHAKEANRQYERLRDKTSMSEYAARGMEDRLIGNRVTREGIDNHPLMQAARAHEVDALATRDAALAEASRAQQHMNATEQSLRTATGALDVARGGPGIELAEETGGLASMRSTMGREMSPQDIAHLSGAGLGDRVVVTGDGEHGYAVEVSGHITRNFEVQRQGREIILQDNFTGNEGEKTSSSGAALVHGMDNMRALGITRVTCQAARGGTMNGYYTWARLGFTGKIPSHVLGAAQQRFGSKVTRVEQIMTKPGGPQWWKQNGQSFQATFSFKSRYSTSTLDRFRTIVNRNK